MSIGHRQERWQAKYDSSSSALFISIIDAVE